MVPLRLRRPWDFYSKCIFLTLCFCFFFQKHFYHCDKDSAAKRETVLGMRKEMTNPIQARWCQAGWFWRLWWCLWVVEPDNGHGCWCTHEHCKPVWGLCGARAQPCTSEIPGCTANLFCIFGFSGGKTVCSPDLCLGQGMYTEGGKSLQTGPSLPSASLLW